MSRRHLDMGKRVVIVLLFTLTCAARADEMHWAFAPVGTPTIPSVRDAAWPCSPLDNFILAKLESAAVKPAAQADRPALIRRATFDLTGLPPTPADVEAFVADPSADAFAKVVERLLASPAYGERWGRHWLDVARYADSNGLDENHAYANAWRYRDYVIAAFNSDKPYDRFLTEQLAGDLLPPFENAPARHERLIATGFLALGPKVLSEPDAKKMEMDVIDEQLDTLGRAFMGMTLGCARCHDHKFDPISTEDYYGLAGIFRSTRTMDRYARPSRWHENVIGTAAEVTAQSTHEEKVLKIGEAIDAIQDDNTPDARNKLKKLRAELTALEKVAPNFITALGVGEGKVIDVPVLFRGDPLQPGKIVPRRFPNVMAGGSPSPLPSDQSGRLELARWLTTSDHPLTARVMVNRIWRWHFGRGIVRSTDNFGLLGEPPTHPELLDWLAMRFVESGWSVKAMHRLIMLSATYQTGVTTDPRSREIDPDNRLFGRMTPRRLEAEALRDAILFTSGTLDTMPAGAPLPKIKNRERVFDVTSKDETDYGSRRRSIYLPVVRNNQYDALQLFDCPDAGVSNGDRTTTTVASQALFLMNGEPMMAASEALATHLLRQHPADEARINELYMRAYGRPAEKAECDRLLDLQNEFQRGGSPQQAWAWICQTVLASNEFAYVN